MTDTGLHPRYNLNDTDFDRMYPVWIQKLSKLHWTPLDIADKAAKFLAYKPGIKVLDIGSGVGKFCLAAANNHPNVSFYGVEQRLNLYQQANYAKEEMQISNVEFMHVNFTQLDLNDYQGFYFFNSFYENIAFADQIDHQIEHSSFRQYHYYSSFLRKALDDRPSGTRLVTYWATQCVIPNSYHLVDLQIHPWLKMWIKM